MFYTNRGGVNSSAPIRFRKKRNLAFGVLTESYDEDLVGKLNLPTILGKSHSMAKKL